MAEHKFSFESLQDTSSIVELLESITQGFKDGSIALASQQDSITLTPKGLLSFAIKAKQKNGESRLVLRIRWKDQTPDQHSPSGTLYIGSE
ncbi:amphi-Trp domain-containing protein [Halodesulfovibrio spirochaetisodalis]|uniref:Amphi-Trp domain-containing protein n=1 Tax=Halodesulfovibrio spirochaetisodalis TaxID=1560234 RepID=A0A1B7XB12_9BACT|nr:amphi-Trp domain-containing protein [Halodesulfovibrio spirochaetisodalis]OBQ46526.1 hypothetical protein SP90_12115 [Halodesulfovibrio spirochaetisodalis]